MLLELVLISQNHIYYVNQESYLMMKKQLRDAYSILTDYFKICRSFEAYIS